MWGIIPAAGRGTRIQPLAFSKELLPVGSKRVSDLEKPCAVSEHVVDRMLAAGVDKLCFVIAPGKSDIVEYFGGRYGRADICYVVQPQPKGLCDALFRALPFVGPDEVACVGLPDTIWFPENGLRLLDDHGRSFLLFPVDEPQRFDAVLFDPTGAVLHIDVKANAPRSNWIWGAFKVKGSILRELQNLWSEPGRGDEYLGTLVNAYLERGGSARAWPAGNTYVDVGTLAGYREALRLLDADGAILEAARGDGGRRVQTGAAAAR
jgi:glucose-1-phosphate thymidylyltransferase